MASAPILRRDVVGTVALAAVMALALAAAARVSAVSERRWGADRRRDELLYYPSGKAVRQAALGHTATAADLAWLKAVQYYGEHRKTDRKYVMMGHIFDIMTDLDPAFENAYIFGSLVTAEDAGDLKGGIALMEKGMAANPGSWALAFNAGFIEYVYAADYPRAAALFRRAATLPGAPEYAVRFAAYSARLAGDPRASLFLWQQLAATTRNAAMRDKAVENIKRLEAELGRARG